MTPVAVVAEEIADNLEEIASVTRTLNTKSIGFFLSGGFVGFAVGMYLGHKFMKEKARAEAFRDSEEEVARLREHYQSKIMAAEPKPDVETIIVERGYDRPLPAPVPVIEPQSLRVDPDPDLEEMPGWDYELELQHRLENPDDPYVLHQEEFYAKETGYRQVSFAYYALDDTMIDDEDRKRDINKLVGMNNLKFGHGSDDPDSVFIRNNEEHLEIEITRVQRSFEEDILGIGPDDGPEDDDD